VPKLNRRSRAPTLQRAENSGAKVARGTGSAGGERAKVAEGASGKQRQGPSKSAKAGAREGARKRRKRELVSVTGEVRYRTLFNYAPDGILIADVNSNYLDANPAMCQMLGYSRRELIGLHASDIVAPDEIDHIAPALDAIQSTTEYARRWKFKRKDGTTFPAEVIATQMPDGNLLAMVRDVSDRVAAERTLHEREAQLRIANRVAKLGAWSAEPQAGHFHWSDELCALFGYPAGTAPGEDALAACSPELQALIHEKCATCMLDGTPFDVEVEALCANGRRMWVRVIGQAERNERSQLVRIHGTIQDIDEQRRLYEQLRQAQKMEAVGQLAGGVAHDFNNLLSVILSYSDLLQEQLGPNEMVRADVQEIRRAAERATSLTGQLLAFSRRQLLQPAVVDIAQIVGGMESLLRRLLGEDVELSLALPESSGRVLVDPTQIEQIVMNLAVNARDAMPEGGSLHIDVGNADLDVRHAASHDELKPGAYVVLTISDTGCGMAESTRERIFEPFFTTKPVGKGTGLGLSTVFGIVKQSRGHIAVDSEPGRGTTFKVYLPRTDAKTVQAAAPLPSPASLTGTETILLVEDDEQVRTVVSQILQRHGYKVLAAAHGEEALAKSRAHSAPIELLITDVVMPRMSGRDLAARLSAARPNIKVLYLSGYTEDPVVKEGVRARGIAFLQKPITPDALYRKVREVLGAAALRTE
jgi:PAS domain S-box-containing protein